MCYRTNSVYAKCLCFDDLQVQNARDQQQYLPLSSYEICTISVHQTEATKPYKKYQISIVLEKVHNCTMVVTIQKTGTWKLICQQYFKKVILIFNLAFVTRKWLQYYFLCTNINIYHRTPKYQIYSKLHSPHR